MEKATYRLEIMYRELQTSVVQDICNYLTRNKGNHIQLFTYNSMVWRIDRKSVYTTCWEKLREVRERF